MASNTTRWIDGDPVTNLFLPDDSNWIVHADILGPRESFSF